MHHNEKVNDIFLIKNGNVRVYNSKFEFLLEYEEGSFFGEYQILFDLLSGCEFVSSTPTKLREDCYYNCILITISKDVFIEVISDV